MLNPRFGRQANIGEPHDQPEPHPCDRARRPCDDRIEPCDPSGGEDARPGIRLRPTRRPPRYRRWVRSSRVVRLSSLAAGPAQTRLPGHGALSPVKCSRALSAPPASLRHACQRSRMSSPTARSGCMRSNTTGFVSSTAATATACAMGLKGIVSKRRDRPYRSGRSPAWVKVKNPNAPAATRIRLMSVIGAGAENNCS